MSAGSCRSVTPFAEHLSYSIHVVRSEVKMQMVTRLHERLSTGLDYHGQFEVEDLISSANARIEISGGIQAPDRPSRCRSGCLHRGHTFAAGA